MADYPAEAFPYVFICSWCEAEQPVTRREAIDLGGHLLGSEDAAEFALGEKYGWTLATPRDLIGTSHWPGVRGRGEARRGVNKKAQPTAAGLGAREQPRVEHFSVSIFNCPR